MLSQSVRLISKNNTSLSLHLLQFREGLEATIGNGLIGEGPQSFTRLQLRRVGRKKDKMDTLRCHHLLALVPACAGWESDGIHHSL